MLTGLLTQHSSAISTAIEALTGAGMLATLTATLLVSRRLKALDRPDLLGLVGIFPALGFALFSFMVLLDPSANAGVLKTSYRCLFGSFTVLAAGWLALRFLWRATKAPAL